MARETTDKQLNVYKRMGENKILELILYTGLLIIIFCLSWFLLRNQLFEGDNFSHSAVQIAGSGLVVCLLVVLIERMLRPIFRRVGTRYRISFISSTLVGGVFLFIGFLSQGSMHVSVSELLQSVLLLVWLLGAAFLGGLIVTAFTYGFIENNYPPSEEVEKRVHERHEIMIGMSLQSSASKRTFDIVVSSLGLIVATPIWLLSALLIWLENPGPLLFVKNSVGKGGRNFRQYKFRTMIRGAEEHTGPVMSEEGDRRVLRVGKLLRKTALDELPQLINILKGEMSFVGPRPQRTVMVDEYLESMPEYAHRHMVLPGLAGLAQVVGDYYLTPRQKLRFDRIYIQHATLKFDMLLIWMAFQITFWYRWQKDWDGKLPRRLLHGPTRR